MRHLEGNDSHNVVIDISGLNSVKRIINVYTSFNPQNNVNPRTKFLYQLEIIKNAMIDKCILLGDFNLNHDKIYDDIMHTELYLMTLNLYWHTKMSSQKLISM